MRLFQVQYLLALFLPVTTTYKIESCDDPPAIEYAITLAQTAMIRPLRAIATDPSNTNGYTAMYKSTIFVPFLQNLMANILRLPVAQAAGRDQEPTFVCTKQGMSQHYDLDYDPLDRCFQTGVTSFWAKDTTLVFLCPSFAGLKAQPSFTPGGPSDIYCPLVKNNVFVGQSDPLVKYQRYDLVHQMAHLYLQNGGLTSQTIPKEVTDWNSCVGLGWMPSERSPSVKNPFNLVYFVACGCLACSTRGSAGKLMRDSRQSGMHRDA